MLLNAIRIELSSTLSAGYQLIRSIFLNLNPIFSIYFLDTPLFERVRLFLLLAIVLLRLSLLRLWLICLLFLLSFLIISLGLVVLIIIVIPALWLIIIFGIVLLRLAIDILIRARLLWSSIRGIVIILLLVGHI